MGAGGRDFHNFLVYFKDNPLYDVKCFTATQIPGIEKRKFPKELAGKLYKEDIPIYQEEELPELIKKFDIDDVYLCYSDLSHQEVMNKASIVLANGADFKLMGPKSTMLESKLPIIAVCAVRTGSGKSQTSRKIVGYFKEKKAKVVVIRHPMPYGDLRKQIVQRFETYEDLAKNNVTIEEREEYEPHLKIGAIVYAGVDYEKILREAEKEADVIVWDGGNNDLPFYKPNLHITVVDPLRPGHEISYYPGEVNFRMADVLVINKMDSATKDGIEIVKKNIKLYNPKATVIKANSTIIVDKPELIRNKKVLVIEDGPTVTHGSMSFGAGYVAAQKYNSIIVNPREHAVGSIKETFEKYQQTTKVLPAMGYSEEQIKELEQTINKSKCDSVIIATPIDLGRLIKINKPSVRVVYELEEIGDIKIEDVLEGMKIERENSAYNNKNKRNIK